MRYLDMTADQLRDAYTSTRTLLWTASQARNARSVIRLDRQLDLIVNVARKRGIPLRKEG